jgi:hypothetical protein
LPSNPVKAPRRIAAAALATGLVGAIIGLAGRHDDELARPDAGDEELTPV